MKNYTAGIDVADHLEEMKKNMKYSWSKATTSDHDQQSLSLSKLTPTKRGKIIRNTT